jgi:microcystin-dependent protein
MARCGCANSVCSCYIVAGPGAEVTGTGARDNPYVVSATATVVDSDGGGNGGSNSGDHHFTGEVIEYAGDSPPTPDYTLCDGKELSRVVYAQLFARIGTTHGAGNGTTTFNVPNHADRVVVGTSGTRPRGTTGGSETATLTAGMLPPHAHAIDHDHAAFTSGTDGAHIHSYAQTQSNSDGSGNVVKRDASNTDATAIAASGSHSHSINVPGYTGSSGNGPGTSAGVPIMQSFSAMPKYIRIQGGP